MFKSNHLYSLISRIPMSANRFTQICDSEILSCAHERLGDVGMSNQTQFTTHHAIKKSRFGRKMLKNISTSQTE